MFYHPFLSILCITGSNESALYPFLRYLHTMPHVKLNVKPSLPRDLSPYQVVITTGCALSEQNDVELEQFVTAGGGWLALLHKPNANASDLLGVKIGEPGPVCELRIIFQNNSHPMARRLPDAVYITNPHRPLNKISDDAETILYADWHYQHSPMLVTRRAGKGSIACTTLQAYDNHSLQRILYRCLLHLSGRSDNDRMHGVGILGYAPSVGKLHGLGIGATPGLSLAAICDLSAERRAQAREDFPDARILHTAEALAEDPQVDLIIIATPPNTHARLCLQMMAAGKHVVCEKPLALTRQETDAMCDMADKKQVHLSCHQNRRFDVDYRAIQQALNEGLIGDLFYMETFVGGFKHPCGYWHSHEPISGGTAYDWGGHYIDWIVSLFPDRARTVIGTRHKRIWHDVTNADQERVQIRFAGGQEAEFMHSDIAAFRKPKWYLLGTEGAIIGCWRHELVYELDPVLYYHDKNIPRTELTPDLTLFRRHHSGQIIEQKLALPPRQDFLFHRNLADHLLTGEPLVAPLEQSVRVVAILEAAARSALNGGTVEVLDA